MLSVYPRQDLFRFSFPQDFFKADIIEKYDEWLNLRDRNVKNIADAINSTIQGLSLPGFGYTPIVQVQNSGSGDSDVSSSPTGSHQKLVADRTFNITFTPTNGFINYFLMLEHYFYYANEAVTVDDREPDMFIEIHDVQNNKLFRFNFQKVKFIGLDSIDFNYNKTTTEFITFEAAFTYDDFDLEFNTPEKDPIHK